MKPQCPNCVRSFENEKEGLTSLAHADSGCVLAAIIKIIIERESCPIPSDKAISEIDIDWLWNRLGPVIDDLERQLVKSS